MKDFLQALPKVERGPFKNDFFTFLSPIMVAYPGARLTPLSIGNGISPCGEISILIPASGVKRPMYSSCSTLSSNVSPVQMT